MVYFCGIAYVMVLLVEGWARGRYLQGRHSVRAAECRRGEYRTVSSNFTRAGPRSLPM